MKNIKFILLLVVLFVTQVYSSSHDKILLEDLKTFTVFKNRMTKGRRSRVLQMECVEGDGCQYFQPPSMQCTQIGFDGYNASWKCETQLQDYYYIGYTRVSCEGYKNPDDRYITRDSCGVRYSLYLTEKGKEHFYNDDSYSHSYNSYSNSNNRNRRNNNNYNESNDDSGFGILVIVAIAIVGYICYRFYKSWKEKRNGNNTNNNDDQPPPYGSWEDDYNNDHRDDDYNNHRHNNNRGNNNNQGSSSSSTASRIGDFFSGFMAGNGMRNRNSGYTTHNHTTNNYYNGSSSSRYRSRSRSRSRSPPRRRSPSPPHTYTSY
eukprot:jgi/Orpsp1_1/1178542/evm.model.c7180000065763.1